MTKVETENPLVEALIKLFAKACGPYHYSSFGFPHRKEVNEELESGRMRYIESGGKIRLAYVIKTLKNDSAHGDFRGETIAIPKGSVFVSDLAVSEHADSDVFEKFSEELKKEQNKKNKRPGLGLFDKEPGQVWMEIYQESSANRRLLDYLQWHRAGTKIMAGSEIKSLWCTGKSPPINWDAVDGPVLVELCRNFIHDGLETVRAELNEYLKKTQSAWENHYSIYNSKNKWAAFALHGFSEDPSFIIKPSEMSRKWKAENPDKMKLEKAVRTTAYNEFPDTLKILKELIPTKFERVRFMRLGSAGGILKRHADITDRFAGTADGMITRLHIPIYTNDQVIVKGWELSGELTEMRWKAGGLYYLDQRKPHEVINQSDTDRIHLVVDCFANEQIRELIRGKDHGKASYR